MAIRVPKGVYSRGTPEWFQERLYGAHAAQGAIAGQLSIVGLFNNGARGRTAYVYYLSTFVTANTHINWEWNKGNPLALWVGDVFGPLNPTLPKGDVAPVSGSHVGCLGFHVAGQEGQGGQPRDLAPGFAFAIIPPGYTWSVETNNPNITIECSFIWAELDA